MGGISPMSMRLYRELELITGDPCALVDRPELARFASSHGQQIGTRRIASLVQEGLLPQPVRVGSSRGLWPFAAVDLVTWILRQQDRGFSNRALRELVLLYLVLDRSLATARVDLGELEHVARTGITDPDANSHVPALFSETLSLLHPADRGCLTWRLKDGSEYTGDAATNLVLTFLMTEADVAAGVARPTSFAQLKLPGIDAPDIAAPDLIILGTPPDMPVEYQNVRQMRRVRTPRRPPARAANQLQFHATAGS